MHTEGKSGALGRARVVLGRQVVSLVTEWPWLRNRLAARRAAPLEGRTLDAQLAAVLGVDDFQYGGGLSRLSPTEARARLVEEVALVEAAPPPGVRTEEVRIPGAAGGLVLRLYTPEGLETPSPAVLYLHGGGWVACDLETHDGYCRRLALGARCRVVAVDYRLAPEHPFPAGLEDALAALRWVLAHAGELGIEPSRVAVAGDSAGGNLSAVVSLRTRAEALRPALQVLIYPATDATCAQPSHARYGQGYFLTREDIAWYLGHYLGGADRRHPEVSPLFAPDLKGAPPALVYTAGFDPLRDEGRAYAERLREAGVEVAYREYEALAHGFTLMTGAVASARKAVEEMAAEVGHRLRR